MLPFILLPDVVEALYLVWVNTDVNTAYSLVRAAQNVRDFFSAQVHVSPGRTVFGKRITPLKNSS